MVKITVGAYPEISSLSLAECPDLQTPVHWESGPN